jgi:signal transduction histidine kinase
MRAPAGPPAAHTGQPRLWERLAPARARLWAVLGIHLAAFAVLYLGTFGLLERASAQAGATAARFQLDEAVRKMPFLWMGSDRHGFPPLLAAHESLGLRLYRRDGALVDASHLSPDPRELEQVRSFLASDQMSDSWVARENGREWARGVVRVNAGTSCQPCHTAGATLGAATMKIDFTGPLAEIRGRLRTRMALLLGSWMALLGGITVLVQRTVARSGLRLRAELAAASAPGAGGGAAGGAASLPAVLPLDPVTAEVHRSLREVLRRQRERESQVATQLAHVDQLASLGQLAAGLAHEIKNPLAGIQGALEVLHDDEAPESTRHIYREMLDELGRVNAILQRLLESGRPAPLRLARTDLTRLLGEVADLLRPSLRRRRVELRVETAEGLGAVRLDGAKIRQVLVNLVQNAAEAMAEAGGHVVVRASGVGDGAALAVAVVDDGPGIPAEQLADVFQPFFTTKFAGTGLGLAISKSIVEQHGGRIDVTSEPGRGTSFVILLPQDGAPALSDEPTDEAAATPALAAAGTVVG